MLWTGQSVRVLFAACFVGNVCVRRTTVLPPRYSNMLASPTGIQCNFNMISQIGVILTNLAHGRTGFQVVDGGAIDNQRHYFDASLIMAMFIDAQIATGMRKNRVVIAGSAASVMVLISAALPWMPEGRYTAIPMQAAMLALVILSGVFILEIIKGPVDHFVEGALSAVLRACCRVAEPADDTPQNHAPDAVAQPDQDGPRKETASTTRTLFLFDDGAISKPPPGHLRILLAPTSFTSSAPRWQED